jgi:hypothetical protein
MRLTVLMIGFDESVAVAVLSNAADPGGDAAPEQLAIISVPIREYQKRIKATSLTCGTPQAFFKA